MAKADMTVTVKLESRSIWLCAKDPDGTFLRIKWQAPIVPRVGDTLWMPTDQRPATAANAERYGNGQDVTVSEVVLYPNGEPEIWCDGFTGWEDGSVKHLFEIASRHPLEAPDDSNDEALDEAGQIAFGRACLPPSDRPRRSR
jgi:hypothetical protein